MYSPWDVNLLRIMKKTKHPQDAGSHVTTDELLAVGIEDWLSRLQPVPCSHTWRKGKGKKAPISLPGKQRMTSIYI